MYDGQIHFKWWKRGVFILPLLSIVWLIVVAATGYDTVDLWPYIIWANINYFITRYIDPDLDQLSFTSADNRMVRELWILGMMFAGYWTFYAFCLFVIAKLGGFAHPWMGAHRTFLSHSVPFGTIVRMLFFNAPIVVLIALIDRGLGIKLLDTNFSPQIVIPYISAQFVAFSVADTIHLKVDSGVLR